MRKSWKAAASKPMLIFFCYKTIGTEAKSIKHRHVLRISARRLVKFNVHVSVHRNSILIRVYIQQDATLHSLFYLETALHVSGGKSLIIRSAKQLYLQHLVFVTPYCYLPLSWNSWNWYECVVGGIHHPQHTQTISNYSTYATHNTLKPFPTIPRTPPTTHSNQFQLFHVRHPQHTQIISNYSTYATHNTLKPVPTILRQRQIAIRCDKYQML